MSDPYPRIVVARDQFGNVARLDASDVYGPPTLVPNVALTPGQVVRFVLEASNPGERALTWRAGLPGAVDVEGPTVVGDSVVFDWTVTAAQVRQASPFGFTLSSDWEFHRHGTHDDHVHFVYDVVPPSE